MPVDEIVKVISIMQNKRVRKTDKTTKKEVRNKVFIERLKIARTSRGLTQEQLAGILGKSTGTISAWEQGTNLPESEILFQLPEVLNCDLDYLIGRIDEQTHDVQLINDRTGLSTKTINLLMASKKLSVWSKKMDNQKEPQGQTFSNYPAYLYYERLSLGDILSKIIENRYADELMDNLEKLIFTDRFYAYWMRNARTDSNWTAESPDEKYNSEEPSVNIGFETVTEKTYFDLIQYKATMLFSKVLDDITDRKESFTLEDIKRFMNVEDDKEAREILRYLELHRQARKHKKRKEV